MECGAARQEEMQVGWKLNADEIDGGQGRSSVNLLLAIKDMKGSSWLVAFVADGALVPSDKSILYLVTFVSSRSLLGYAPYWMIITVET